MPKRSLKKELLAKNSYLRPHLTKLHILSCKKYRTVPLTAVIPVMVNVTLKSPVVKYDIKKIDIIITTL